MKKELGSDASFGVAAAVLGILSIILGIFTNPLAGIASGIVAFVFSKKQEQRVSTEWSRAARTLSIVGMVVSVLILVVSIIVSAYIAKNPGLLASLQGSQYP